MKSSNKIMFVLFWPCISLCVHNMQYISNIITFT